jgi:hypothetical protein
VLWQRFGGGTAIVPPPSILLANASITSSSSDTGAADARPAWRRRAGAALMQPVRAMVRCFGFCCVGLCLLLV